MTMEKLLLEKTVVTISGKTILSGVDLRAAAGSFTAVLGASGCGKSTLLKTIAGLLPVAEGEIRIGGRDASAIPAHQRQAVIVFQDTRLFPHMSVAENIAYPMKIKGIAETDRAGRVETLLAAVQLEGYGNKRTQTLSGGEQQRIALARALAAEPAILLLDEPFSALDENLRFDMRCLVMKLHREYAMTTIMVTHDKQEAFGMADEVVVMAKGRVLQTGRPEELINNPGCLSVARYLGNAVFIRGRVSNSRFTAPELSLGCDAADGAYVLMIRNADIVPAEGRDFKIAERMFTGAGYEYLLEHVITGFKIRAAGTVGGGWTIDTADKRFEPGQPVTIACSPDRVRFFPNEE